MLILCCGPDSFRALARAKELEVAFRQKHDPKGRSIERLSSGKDGVEEMIGKAAGASLFSSMRFLRVDGLISSCPKVKQKALLEALSRDVEAMIVVSVEEEMPPASVMKPYELLPKIIVKDYPLLTGTAFLTWAREIAKSIGNVDEKSMSNLARVCDGNSWMFVNEAMKLAAGARPELDTDSSEVSAYDVADQVIRKDLRRRKTIDAMEFGFSEMSILIQQSLAALRIRDNDSTGISPFVVRKLQAMNMVEPAIVFASALEMLFVQRTGLCTEPESVSLIP